MHNITEKSLR